MRAVAKIGQMFWEIIVMRVWWLKLNNQKCHHTLVLRRSEFDSCCLIYFSVNFSLQEKAKTDGKRSGMAHLKRKYIQCRQIECHSICLASNKIAALRFWSSPRPTNFHSECGCANFLWCLQLKWFVSRRLAAVDANIWDRLQMNSSSN